MYNGQFAHRCHGNLRLRVVHLVTSLNFGGVERHMETLGRNISATKHDITFLALNGGGPSAETLQEIGCKVVCLGCRARIPNLLALFKLFIILRKLSPDVVHTHGAEANFHGMIAAWAARVPIRVAEEIGVPMHSRKANWVFRQVYRASHRVIGISDAVVRWLVASREVPVSKTVRIYNPVEISTDQESGTLSRDVFRIAFVGRLEPVKNPLALLKAFQRLLAEGIVSELWIIGEGSERNKLAKFIQEKELHESVCLYGYQPAPEALICQCHIYLQPSLAEGFGLALVEAMECGLPVIATAVGGAPEIIEHGRTGWLLEGTTPEHIASALKRAWSLGPAKLKEIGQHARESVENRFCPNDYILRLEKLYLQVANENGFDVTDG